MGESPTRGIEPPALPRGDPEALRARFSDPRPVLLDGPTGTELMRRGYETRLPLWSAGANLEVPQLLASIHRDYADAGAEIHTANTFRTNPSTLLRARWHGDPAALVRGAVRQARRGLGPRTGWVVASLAPVEDCYDPKRVPPTERVRAEHQAHVDLIEQTGVDGYLVETMNTVREARAATAAATTTRKPVLVSFVPDRDGVLLSGESWAEAVEAVASFAPIAIMVNCASIEGTTKALRALSNEWDGRFGAYANVGTADARIGWEAGRDVSDAEFVRAAADWVAAGASVIGSCCGTTPTTTVRLRRLLDGLRSAERVSILDEGST